MLSFQHPPVFRDIGAGSASNKPALAHSERSQVHNSTSSAFTVYENNPKNTRILIVGEKLHCTTIVSTLEKASYSVTQIESQAQALDIVGNAHPYKVAGIYSSGNPAIFTFITKLREVSDIPTIVFVSGGTETTNKFLKSGASDCLFTPICPELLKVRVSCILENLQLKEILSKASTTPPPNPVAEYTVKINTTSNVALEELKSIIADLERRVEWADAEIEKKDTEISTLQQQLNAISWRTSLLESERHKGETLTQQLSQKEREIDDMRKNMSRALETPLQVITRTLTQISQGNFDNTQLKQTFSTLVQNISSTSQLYQPALTKNQILSSLNVDDMTRQWLLYEFTTTSTEPAPQSQIIVPPRTTSPIPSPSPMQDILLTHQPPPRPQSPLLPEPRPRSPKLLPLNTSDKSSSGEPARNLKSGRSIDDILKRAGTTDIQAVNSYNCNVWLFDNEELALLAWGMFDDLGLVTQFKIPQVAFFQLMETLKV